MKLLIFTGRKMKVNLRKFAAIFLFFGFLQPYIIQSQNVTGNHEQKLLQYREELAFINYCETRHNYTDALLLLNRLSHAPDLPTALRDSVNFQLGWDYYTIKDLDSSVYFLFKVTDQNPQYLKSRFFVAYNTLFLERRSEAQSIFSGIQLPEKLRDSLGALTKELIAFELSGIALLDRDYESFTKYSSQFSHSYYTLATEEKNLLEYNKLLKTFRPKSRGLAGIMSAIIPGSGKIYAGKTGEGVAAFLIVSSLGLIGIENFNKDGLENWKTMLAGGLFTIYYTGNIIGSVKAASRYNHAYTQTLDNRILFDLHIPLRNIFN